MKKVQYSYSGEQPVKIQKIGDLYQVNFDTQEIVLSTENEQQPATGFRCLYARVDELSYDKLVAAIIGIKHDSSDTEAILLNYQQALDGDSALSDQKRTEYVAEYQSLQAWRAHAKEVAKECLL